MEIVKVIGATVLSAASLFAIGKLIGHKQISQLDFFDYITGITIGSIAAELATTLDDPWWKPFLSLVTFGCITFALSVMTSKLPRLRKYINGSPTIILQDHTIYRKNMKKAKLELSELMMMCRQEGYYDLNDIQTAVFEYNGRLTILPVSNKRPLNPEDMSISPPPASIGTEVIMDGRILHDNLRRMELDPDWLNGKLAEQGFHSAKEVFLGVCDGNKNLTVFQSK